MKEERLIILAMLKEGKISVEEATELLEALEGKGEKEQTSSKYDKNKKLTNKTLEEIGLDIGNAVSNMIDGIRDMGGSFNLNFNNDTIHLDLEEDLSTIENPILDFRAINGPIIINTWEKDTLSIKVTCQYKNGLLDYNRDFHKFYIEDNKIIFTPIYNKDISVKLDIFVPNKRYGEILLNTSNGKIHIEDVDVNKLNCITTNSSIYASKIDGEEIYLNTKNGKIEAIDISSKKIDLSTSNGRIFCNHADINIATNVKLYTSNGSITSNLNGLTKGTYFDLETSMGSVSLELPNITYMNKDNEFSGNKRIIGHNSNYDESNENIQYIASTSNGSIKII